MSRRLRWALLAPILTLPLLVSTAQAVPPPRNGAGWAEVSEGYIAVAPELVPGVGYLTDGQLLVAWTQMDGPEAGLWTSTVDPEQAADFSRRHLTSSGLGLAPNVVSRAGGADIFYVGDGNARRLSFDAATGEASPTGETFLVQGAQLGNVYDTARRPNGAIVVNQGRRWHVGPVGDGEDADNFLSESVTGAVGIYRSSIATAGQTTYLEYATNDGSGLYVVPIEPSVGTPTKLPGSKHYDQPLALEGSTTNTLWAAYCAGDLLCEQLVLRDVLVGRSLVVPTGDYPAQIAIAPAPGGRMWVVWRSGNAAVSAVRTNKAGTAFGAVQRSAPFNTLNSVHSVVAIGERGPVDVVVNGRQQLWHKRFLVPMTAAAAPASWRVNRKQTVSFKVRDAGDALSGAKVSLVGKSCTTGATGGCSITVPARSAPTTLTATVTKAGYQQTSVPLRVVR